MRRDSMLVAGPARALLFTSALILSAPVLADFYLGAGVGYADLDSPMTAPVFGNLPPAFGPAPANVRFSREDSDTAWKLYGGYRLTDYLGVELGYMALGPIESTLRYDLPLIIPGPPPQSVDATTTQHTDVDTSGFSLSAVLSYPNASGFTPFAKAGIFRWREEVDTSLSLDADFPLVFLPSSTFSDTETGTGLILAAGVDYRVTDRLFVRGEYDYMDDVADRNIRVLVWVCG